jgi:YVTN family beta-propeller protein
MRSLLLLAAAAGPALPETIFVAHKWADSAGFYDTRTGKSLAVIPVGKKPHEIVVSADGRFAYLSNYGVDRYTETSPGENTITIVDLAAREPAGAIELGKFRRPHGMRLGLTGMLYVTCDYPPSVVVVDPVARQVAGSIAVGQELPHMIEVTPDERKAYTGNSGSGTVTAIDLGSRGILRHIEIGGVPMGMAMSADGRRLYACNRTGDSVAVIDTEKDTRIATISIPGHPARALALPDGRHLLVSLIDAGEVAVVAIPEHKVVSRFRAGAYCEGLAVDGTGRFGYISAQGEDKVIKFALGSWTRLLEIPTRSRPDPIVVLP